MSRKKSAKTLTHKRSVVMTEAEYEKFLNTTSVLGISGNALARASLLYVLEKVYPDEKVIDFDELSEVMSSIGE